MDGIISMDNMRPMLLKTPTKTPIKKKTSNEISLLPAHDWRTSDQDEINRRILRAREE